MDTICIMCPMGCALHVEKAGENVVVKGNTCPRGEKYGRQEFVSPKRMVTTLLKVNRGGVVSVKTSEPADKNKVNEIIHAVASVELTPPIKMGDIVVKNVANSGVDLIATSDYAHNED